jgi:hypothetical protein
MTGALRPESRILKPGAVSGKLRAFQLLSSCFEQFRRFFWEFCRDLFGSPVNRKPGVGAQQPLANRSQHPASVPWMPAPIPIQTPRH